MRLCRKARRAGRERAFSQVSGRNCQGEPGHFARAHFKRRSSFHRRMLKGARTSGRIDGDPALQCQEQFSEVAKFTSQKKQVVELTVAHEAVKFIPQELAKNRMKQTVRQCQEEIVEALQFIPRSS